jgi:hypothetical protein
MERGRAAAHERPKRYDPQLLPDLPPLMRAERSGPMSWLRAMSKRRGLHGVVSKSGGNGMRCSGFGRSNLSRES